MMVVKLFFLFALLSIHASVADDVIAVPKKFTRSRYSHRRSTTTATTTPPGTELLSSSNNYDNSVDMVTDIFSDELLPNKIEQLVTNNPFDDSNDTSTTTTPIAPTTAPIDGDTLNTSTMVSNLIDAIITEDGIENLTEKELETVTEERMPHFRGIFPCGERHDDNHHPWIAVLVHTDPSGRSRKKTLSKGVLIDQRHVLTTVSSLHNSRPFWIVSRVRLGDTPVVSVIDNKQVNNKTGTIQIGIEEIFQHKNRDIALIKLSENVNFTNSIRPICLPDTDYYNFTELYMHMCKKDDSKNSIVRTVTTSPLSPQDCEIMFKRKRATTTPEEFCAWDETGDSCTGDLGGPLIAMDNGRYSVIGLNSHINSRVKFNYEDYPGIYVRVGSHLSWIRKVTSL